MKKKAHYFDLVYGVVQMIPHGRVCTYGIIADYLALGSARMVGWALNQSFSSEMSIPAHRVVNRNGELSGRAHFSSPDMMQQLLENEGAEIVGNKILNFKEILWFPEDY